MAEENRCPECGASLSPDAAPGQLCPRCLLLIVLEPETDPGAEPTQTPPDETKSTEINAVESTQPGRIGPYRLTRKLGEGGMGEVYEAEQQEPVRRKVALKLIKWGMDTRRVVARFEAERQALAMMDHPNIARVFDAGATEQGRPYFAMELVKGVPITDYCDRHKLSTRERLELFQLVCEGVQHAHQKGIIHRDIKPSNVMVTIQDDKPVPKIIDFGVAKATEQRLTEKTVFTELGQLVGTPEYMSPEQAEMTGLDIDTRTDVYSLGVLLYELLSGALPFEPRELRKAGYDEIRRRIREDEPAKPSTRISSLGEEATTAASNRATAPGALVRRLRGDLDWISMKALEKDRTRRYGSAADLAADLGRHLQSEPVLAGPPSTVYKMNKFVRRHRFGVAAASALSLTLVFGVIGTSVGMVRARAETRRAEAGKLFALAQLALDDSPSSALAYTAASLELTDAPETRRFALRVLHQGPTAFVNIMPEYALSMDFSSDGRMLAAGGWRGTHQLWSQNGSTLIEPHGNVARTGGLLKQDETRITSHETDELVFVEFSDDGRFHVSSSDKSVRIWSVPEAREVRTLDVKPWWFEVRGQSLLTLTPIDDIRNFEIARWPLTGGEPEVVATWERPSSLSDALALQRVDVDPSGEWLAYAEGPDLFVRPLRQAGKAATRQIGSGENRITRVLFHPDGERIATLERIDDERGVIRLWSESGSSSEPLRSFEAPVPVFRDTPAARSRTIRFDSDGRWMAAPTYLDGSILLWDLSAPPDTEPLVLRQDPERQATNGLAIHPKGTWLAAADLNVAIYPLDGDLPWDLGLGNSPGDPHLFDPQGRWLVSVSWEGKAQLWPLLPSAGSGSRILFDAGDVPLTHAKLLPDGKTIAIGVWDGRIVIAPISGGSTRELRGFQSPLGGLALDREGRRLAACGGWKIASDSVIRVWDLQTGEMQLLDPGDQQGMFSIDFTPDGNLLTAGMAGLRLWNTESGESELLVPHPAKGVLGPDGRHVLLASRPVSSTGNEVHAYVYDLRERVLRELVGFGERVNSVAWHPSGEYVVTTDVFGVVRVGAMTGEQPHLLFGGYGHVVVSPDGHRIATKGEDTLRLWPWPEGEPFHTLPHEEFVARLHSLTNYRIERDNESITGYRLALGPFPGWEDLPKW